jgi:murein DD-endopeptidase MepM/ murein hydrolase activator NlpD
MAYTGLSASQWSGVPELVRSSIEEAQNMGRMAQTLRPIANPFSTVDSVTSGLPQYEAPESTQSVSVEQALSQLNPYAATRFLGPRTAAEQGYGYIDPQGNEQQYTFPTVDPSGGGSGYGGSLVGGLLGERQPLAPTLISDASATLDQMLARQNQLLNQAAAAHQVNAAAAAASYEHDAAILQREIGELQNQLGNVNAVYGQWEQEAKNRIIDNASRAADAFYDYMDRINQGYNEYDALVASRFQEYQAAVRKNVQDYTAATNKGYADLSAEMPEFYRPIFRAVAEGNTQALEGFRAARQKFDASIEGMVTNNTEIFKEHMGRIASDNPALLDELMVDVNRLAQQAVQMADLDLTQHAEMREAVGRVAETTANYQLATQVLGLEQQRMQYVNEARRQRDQLLNVSSRAWEGALEQSAASRAQALSEVNRQLEQTMINMDDQIATLFEQNESTKNQIRYELEQSLQSLQDQYRGRELDFTWGQIARDTDFQGISGQLNAENGITPWAVGAADAEQALRDAGVVGAEAMYITDMVGEFVRNEGFSWSQFIENPNVAAEMARAISDRLGIGIAEEEVQAGIESVLLQREFFPATAAGWQQGISWLRDELSDAIPALPAGRFEQAATNVILQTLTGLPWDRQELVAQTFDLFDKGREAYEQSAYGAFPEGVRFPLPMGQTYQLSNDYGAGRPGGRSHGGNDIAARLNTPIYAFAPGTVAQVWDDGANYGGYSIEIDHGNGFKSRYMHLAQLPDLPEGTQVGLNTIIGLVGDTGNAMNPHLHFSLYQQGDAPSPQGGGYAYQTVDPYEWLKQVMPGG